MFSESISFFSTPQHTSPVPNMYEIVGKSEHIRFRYCSEEGFNHHMVTFKPDSEDVIIATQPRTGTTWLQVICHLLRYGNTNYDNIYEVVPWHQLALDLDQDVMNQGGYRPRLFKSHQLISAEVPGCRYITTIRDPVETLRSWWSFTKKNGVPESQNLTLEQFYENPLLFQQRMIMWAGAWSYQREAYLLRHHPRILVLIYEDMVKDLRSQLPRIAKFLGLQTPLEEKMVNRILQASTKETMLYDISKYSDDYLKKRMIEVGSYSGGWNISGISPKIVKTSNHSQSITPKLRTAVERDFCQHIRKVVPGCSGYGDLQEAIRKAYKKID